MARERIYLFDTTLRDGAQTSGVNFSVEDKKLIAQALDRLGIDYVEGGWPGANPTDTRFFEEAPTLGSAKMTAFGTRALAPALSIPGGPRRGGVSASPRRSRTVVYPCVYPCPFVSNDHPHFNRKIIGVER